MTQETKNWIDSQTYEELLERWRHAPVGDKLFQGETGTYYSDAMFRKKSELSHEDAVNASKRVGWGKKIIY